MFVEIYEDLEPNAPLLAIENYCQICTEANKN